MASVLRPAIESLNLIGLFVQDSTAADRWAQGHDYREFMPARVRQTLGVGDDPIYSWLSEVSHPRFAGFRMTTFRVVHAEESVDDPIPTLRGFIGGLPHDIPPVLIATTFPSNVLCQLGLQLGHCTVTVEVARTWTTVVRSIVETVRPGYEAVARVLDEMAGDRDEIRETIRQILARNDYVLQQAREMEQIALEDLERQDRERHSE